MAFDHLAHRVRERGDLPDGPGDPCDARLVEAQAVEQRVADLSPPADLHVALVRREDLVHACLQSRRDRLERRILRCRIRPRELT